MNAAPVRLCCGMRHYGALCPDGKVMCEVCFDRFPPEDLFTDSHGTWNLCKLCAPHVR